MKEGWYHNTGYGIEILQFREEKKVCDDVEDRDDHFFVTSPYPRNPRVLCITGILPDVSGIGRGEIDSLVFNLIRLDREKPGEPIILVINGPGGATEALQAILNTICFLHSPAYTVANNVSSALAYLFIAGAKGHRYIFKDGYILLHLSSMVRPPHRKRCWQFWEKYSGGFGQDRVQKIDKLLAKIVLDCSNAKELLARLGDWQDENDPQELIRGILALLRRDQVFSAQEAVQCGLADKIIGQEEFDMLFQ